MSFKKYHPLLKESMETLGIEQPNAFQKKILPIIKSGASVYGIGPKGCGKTTTLIISVIQKLKAEAFEDSPRALILVKDKQEALQLKEKFEAFTANTDLRLYCAYAAKNLETQREDIYYGVDILIATPKQLSKLYHLNSVHTGELKLFVVHDADFINRDNNHNYILRLTESTPKAQFIIFSENFNSKIAAYQDSFMFNARMVKVKS